MAGRPVCNNRSPQIANHLMGFHQDATGPILFKAERFNPGIDDTPLPGPIFAHRQAHVHCPAFHTVGPFDLRMHRRQCRVDDAAYAALKRS